MISFMYFDMSHIAIDLILLKLFTFVNLSMTLDIQALSEQYLIRHIIKVQFLHKAPFKKTLVQISLTNSLKKENLCNIIFNLE